MPPEKVTDPEEMLARSLQSVIDASSVHLEATVEGHVPGALLDRPEASVALDGTRVEADARPKDARTRAHVEIPALDATLDTVTVWDGAWYRTDPAAAWSRATLGASPRTRASTPTRSRSSTACAATWRTPRSRPPSPTSPAPRRPGRCRHIVLDAGADPTGILALLLPEANRGALPPVETTVTLDTDVATLRPVQLAVDMRSDDGSVDLHLVVDASRWDEDAHHRRACRVLTGPDRYPT